MGINFYLKNIPDHEGNERMIECFRFESEEKVIRRNRSVPKVLIDEIVDEHTIKEYPEEYEAFKAGSEEKKPSPAKKAVKTLLGSDKATAKKKGGKKK
jgi:hypothetical protein